MKLFKAIMFSLENLIGLIFVFWLLLFTSGLSYYLKWSFKDKYTFKGSELCGATRFP